MKVPDFVSSLKNITNNNNNNNKGDNSSSGIKMLSATKNTYSKLDSIKEIKEELDQPLQPHIEPIQQNQCSTIQAFGNTIKSFVGVGILALPYAIKQSGLWAGIIGLVVIGFVSAYTMKILVRCKIEMELRRKFASETNPSAHLIDEPEITYGYIGQHIFGRLGLWLVNFAIVTSQLGFCCAYILFIGHNLHSIWSDVDMRLYAVILFPLYVLLSWIRTMRYLAPVAIAANAALILAVTTVFYYGFSELKVERSYPFINISTFPLFFGIAVFGYEGINLAIPIQSSMLNPRAYPRMLDLSLVCVGVLYVLFGSLGYLFFGEDTDPIITNNLGRSSAIVIVVRLALVFELILTYPVQLFPVTIIIEHAFGNHLKSYKALKQNIIRTIIVGFTVGISVVVPYFDLLTSLVGSFSNSMVVFIFPTLFLLAIFRGRLTWPEKVLNVVILVFGIAASAISSAIAIISIIQQVQSGSHSAEQYEFE